MLVKGAPGITPVPVKQIWWIWVNRLHEFTRNAAQNKQSTPKSELLLWGILSPHCLSTRVIFLHTWFILDLLWTGSNCCCMLSGICVTKSQLHSSHIFTIVNTRRSRFLGFRSISWWRRIDFHNMVISCHGNVCHFQSYKYFAQFVKITSQCSEVC